MKKRQFLTIAAKGVLLCLTVFSGYARITPINSLQEITDFCNTIKGSCLIVFDVDQTLITPADALWQEDHIWQIDPLKEHQFENQYKTNAERDHIVSDRLLHCAMKSVESITVSIIQDLQTHPFKIIALTNFGPDQFGLIPSIKEWRFKQLFDLGIDFSKSFPDVTFCFSHLASSVSENGGYPTLFKGILFAANNPKGIVLAAFLDVINQKFETIIVIDDRDKYLESIEKEMKARNQDVQCFWYVGAEKNKAVRKDDVIQLQLAYIHDQHTYLSDAEAEKIIQACKDGIANPA